MAPDATLIETERLWLAGWGTDQIEDVIRLHSDPLVAKFYSPEGLPWSREKCENRLREWIDDFRDHRLGKLRIVRKEDGVLLGRAGFSFHAPTGEPEIGYALFSQFWGKGYATEAAAGLRDWFFRETQGDHFIGFAHEDNTASLDVLERIGMRFTHSQVFSEMPHNFYIYSRPAPR